MISSIASAVVPSDPVIVGATWGLLVLLVAAELVPHEGRLLNLVARYLGAFSTPLLFFFALAVVVKIVRSISG